MKISRRKALRLATFIGTIWLTSNDTIFAEEEKTNINIKRKKAIVIGAGMAGVTAAKQLLEKHLLEPFPFVLRRYRIAQLVRVVRYVPPFLRGILSKLIPYTKSWIHTVITGLEWIHTHSQNSETMPSPHESLGQGV